MTPQRIAELVQAAYLDGFNDGALCYSELPKNVERYAEQAWEVSATSSTWRDILKEQKP